MVFMKHLSYAAKEEPPKLFPSLYKNNYAIHLDVCIINHWLESFQLSLT
jgi:hypothetical protein